MSKLKQPRRHFLKQVTAASVISVVVLSGCASGGSATVAKAIASPEATAALTSAKAALKKAGSVGGAWKPTGGLIKKAEALIKENKAAEAIKLAKKAQSQGVTGYEQAMAQLKAGPRF